MELNNNAKDISLKSSRFRYCFDFKIFCNITRLDNNHTKMYNTNIELRIITNAIIFILRQIVEKLAEYTRSFIGCLLDLLLSRFPRRIQHGIHFSISLNLNRNQFIHGNETIGVAWLSVA